MKTNANMLAVAGILILCPLAGGASEPPRHESLGPLTRMDPNARKPANLIAIHGDPGIGLTSNSSGVCGRIGDSDKWWLGLSGRTGMPENVGLMEFVRGTGEFRQRELLGLREVSGISADGRFAFGWREGKRWQVWECVSLQNNQPLWAVEKDMQVMDAVFSPDSGQLIVLHGLSEKYQPVMACAVSWLDVASGRRLRRVPLPMELPPFSSSSNRHLLALSMGSLFIACPGKDEGAYLVIGPDADEPVAVDTSGTGCGPAPKLAVGGCNSELIAFFDDSGILVGRHKAGALKELGRINLRPPEDGNTYTPGVVFSPDGKLMVVSRCGKTLVLEIGEDRLGSVVKTLPEGSSAGGFTADGAYFVCIDDGSGRVWNTRTWAVDDPLDHREHPVHCCPVTEAGYAISGDWIVSSDQNKLLLWSKKGEIMAQLISPKDGDGSRLMMQSAIIVEKSRKVYAADGWNFLEWNLDEVQKRLERRPINVPRVRGTVVFDDRKSAGTCPEVMNIAMDSTGRHLVTATRLEVRFRSLDSPAESRMLPVPRQIIMMKPRSFQIAGTSGRVFLESSMQVYELDPAGIKDAVLLHKSSGALDAAAGRIVGVEHLPNRDSFLYQTSLGEQRPQGAPHDDGVSLPQDWNLYSFDHRMLSAANGSMVVVRGKRNSDGMGMLGVVDLAAKRLLWSEVLPWSPTTASISADGKRLLIGSSNKALYVFDFERILKGR